METARRLGTNEFIGQIDTGLEHAGAFVSLIGAVDHVDPHEHSESHFVLVNSGDYKTIARGGEGWIGAGGIIYNPPGTRHDDAFTTAGTLTTLSLSSDLLSRLRAPPQDGPPRLLGARCGALIRSVLHESADPDRYATLAIETACAEILAAITLPLHTSHSPSWIERACEQIRAECLCSIDLGHLAGGLDIHPVYFARAFRKFVGMSPSTYARRCRDGSARHLLARSNLSLVEVALECGFADQSAFTKAFKRTHGVTPNIFRELWRR